MSENKIAKATINPQRILMCSPGFFEILYEINPWMDIKKQPLADKAQQQWIQLTTNLKAAGATLEYIPPVKGLPDMVYTANGGLIRKKKVVLSRFRVKERQGEEQYFRQWFEEHGLKVLNVKKGAFEGEGDALFAGDLLICGTGFRSEGSASEEVADLLNAKAMILCELVNPYFYHVDTCICPLTEQLAFFHRSAFSKSTQQTLEKNFELFDVPTEEAEKFVCNAVVLGKNVVLPADCPVTYQWLASKGYTAMPSPLNEFLRGGGAAKCLTLFLDRA